MAETPVSLETIEKMVANILRHLGFSAAESKFIGGDYIEAELEGKKTHGLGKLLTLSPAAKKRGTPKIVTESESFAVIDGRREVGILVAQRAARLASEKASQWGIGIVLAQNFSRYGRLKPFVREIVSCGHVGIVLNSGGPPAVVPTGGREPVLGTNPIAFGFPTTHGQPVLIDLATSKSVWGAIRQVILENRDLPADTFVDEDGITTQDPAAAEGVLPFGGAKGYALCLAIELLSGLAPSTKMGKDVNDEYDLGAVFVAIDPRAFGSGYETKVSGIVDQLHNSSPRGSVSIPGELASQRAEVVGLRGSIEVDESVLLELERMSTGSEPEMRINDKTN